MLAAIRYKSQNFSHFTGYIISFCSHNAPVWMFLVGRWGALPHSIIQGPSGWGICHLPHMASQVSLHVDIYQGKRLGGKVTHISDSPEQSSDIPHWGKPVTCPDVDERRRGVGTVVSGGAATSQQLLLTKERGREALQNSLSALPQSMASKGHEM